MKVIILYESFFGNTRTIAQAMFSAFEKNENLMVKNIAEVSWADVSDAGILVVGSATRGFRPCEETRAFLDTIPQKGLKGVRVAAFDTRLFLPDVKSKAVRFIVKTGGYAARHIANALEKKGGILAVPPEGFLVSGEEGPLVKGETERAIEWAKSFIVV
jgi:flavodoxin